MDRLTKPKEFLKELRLVDSDYQDSGMINHIADLLERYHKREVKNITHEASSESQSVRDNETKRKVCNNPYYSRCSLFYQNGCKGCPKFR